MKGEEGPANCKAVMSTSGKLKIEKREEEKDKKNLINNFFFF